MKIYLAGTTMLRERERALLSLTKNRLQSYFYLEECTTIMELLNENLHSKRI
jgi:hypothetical protein